MQCGVPKKGHICPYQPKLKRRPDEPPPVMKNAATQVEIDEYMIMRRLNLEIQGFPESYAIEPTSNDMVMGVGDGTTSSTASGPGSTSGPVRTVGVGVGTDPMESTSPQHHNMHSPHRPPPPPHAPHYSSLSHSQTTSHSSQPPPHPSPHHRLPPHHSESPHHGPYHRNNTPQHQNPSPRHYRSPHHPPVPPHPHSSSRRGGPPHDYHPTYNNNNNDSNNNSTPSHPGALSRTSDPSPMHLYHRDMTPSVSATISTSSGSQQPVGMGGAKF